MSDVVTKVDNAQLGFIDPAKIKMSKVMLRGCNKKADSYTELQQSVKVHGILNPIRVRPLPDEPGFYGLVDGLQRLNCSLDLAMPTIPAMIVPMEEGEILEAQIVANIQKIETKPVEYTKGLLHLLQISPTLTKKSLCARLGKSEAWLDARLSLLTLTPNLQALVSEGKIVLANAYALAKIPVDKQEDWSVRAQTETTTEFVSAVQTYVRELQKAAREGRDHDPNKFVLNPKFQKMDTIKTEIDNQVVGKLLIQQTGVTTALDGFILGLKWALKSDPISAAEAEKAFREKLSTQESDKKARAMERLQKKLEEAKAAA